MNGTKSSAVGIGGWLSILVFKLGVSTMVRALGGLSDGVSVLGLLSIGSAILSGVAAYLLLNKNPKGVLLCKVFLTVDAGYYCLELIDSMFSASNTSGPMPAWYKPSGYFLACILWLLYLIRSERVKNTF